MITIFTPTYNRKNELKRLYQSLLKQDSSNFEWLIIDDGSQDKTQNYIKTLIKENKIKIRYFLKENGGKPSAYNMGLEKAEGDIFLSIDSDDILNENILKEIEKDFKTLNKNAGVIYLQNNIKTKKIIGTKFPKDGESQNYYDIYHKLKVKGDKLIVLKTDIAKRYPFPLIEKEKFIPEALIFNRISKNYNLKCRNFVAASKEYLENGYSNNYFSLVKKNPIGNSLYFKEEYEFSHSFYNVYGYILFSIYAKQKFKTILKNHPAKIKIIFMYIPVLIISKIKR